jgi:hypothetical protein
MRREEIWILDFDRCLGSGVLYEHAEAALEQLSPLAKDRIVAMRAKVEGEGGSFDVISYLEQDEASLRDEFLKVFEGIVSANDAQIYRNEGATALLDYLRTENITYMIMTYGGVAWQEAKLKAAELDNLPYIVVDSKIKGDKISSWYQESDKMFFVPFPDGSIRRSSSLCLVDDKTVAFTGLPEQARGYWLRSENMLKSQQGEVPPSVAVVDSLHDIVRLERKVTSR